MDRFYYRNTMQPYMSTTKTIQEALNDELFLPLRYVILTGGDQKCNRLGSLASSVNIVALTNPAGENPPLKLRHLDKTIVKRMFQIFNKELNALENGPSTKSGLSKKGLAILTDLVSESLEKLNPKLGGTTEKMRKTLTVLKRLDQAINNGVFATSVGDPAIKKQRSGISASKIAHQLDHSMSLINEIILRQRKMNSRLEHLESIQKYLGML
uniref:Uncharacterized protein n=1 Tax=Romanomermis culicivorax TaxID=13658 RepID=A0A915JUZ9_ROMCU